jgi:hypothetical protein
MASAGVQITYTGRGRVLIDVMETETITKADVTAMRMVSAVRWLASLYATKGEIVPARDYFATRWPMDVSVTAIKAPIGGGTSGFFATPPSLTSAFVAAVHPFSLLGRLALRRVPFHTPISHGAPAASFAWVGAAMVKPAARLTYTPGTGLAPLKAAGILVETGELLKLDTRVERVVIGDLQLAYVPWLDGQFTDPTVAAVAGESPGSITNGISPIASAGSTPDDAIEDLRLLLATFVAGGGRAESAVLLMSSANAVALNLADPQRFGTLTRDGGTLGGLPVLASDSVGYQLVMVDAGQVLVADEGEADLSLALHASVEMNDAPTQDGSVGTGASLVNLWQANLAGIRIERTINWRAPSGSVARVSGAQYYAAGSPLS